MIILGIDVGLDGAVALLCDGLPPQVRDTPTGRDKKHRIYLVAEMRALLLLEVADATGGVVDPTGIHVFIERVHAMPGQGVRSMFGMGEGLGLWRGLVVGLGWPLTLVTPQAWQKTMMAGQQRGKDASRARAQELFPSLVSELNLKKHHGRSDALLIAAHGRLALGGGS